MSRYCLLLACAFLATCLAQDTGRYQQKLNNVNDGRYYGGESGRYRPSDEGKYREDYSGRYGGNDGRYVPDDSGRYNPDDSGLYRGQNLGYEGDNSGAYKGDEDRYIQEKFGAGDGRGFGAGDGRGFGAGDGRGVGAGVGRGFVADKGSKVAPKPKKVVELVGAGSGISSAGRFGDAPNLKHGDAAGLYDNRNYRIIRLEGGLQEDGYHYLYETENKIFGEEEGKLANVGTDEEGMKAFGYYTYTGPDGIEYTVKYTADENGFLPQGEHLPTPPPVPEAILRGLEFQRAQGTL